MKTALRRISLLLFIAQTCAVAPAFAATPGNILASADSATWTRGETPPKPWQVNKIGSEKTVMITELNGSSWLEFKDTSTERDFYVLQQFLPIKSGKLSFRLAIASGNSGQLGIYLGQGKAASLNERIISIKVSASGNVGLGSSASGSSSDREDTGVSLSRGASDYPKIDHLFIEFSSPNGDLYLRLGRVASDGKQDFLSECTFPGQGYAISALRISTDIGATAHFCVTDLVLTTLPERGTP